MSDEIPTTDTRKALADVGDTPRVTTTTPPPAAPPGTGLFDNHGGAFDPSRHSVDRNGNPMLHASGRWMLKRGNGARRNAGKPPSGFVSVAPKPPPVSAAQSAQSADAAPAAPAAAATSSPVHDATVEMQPTLTEDDYETTANGIQRGLFSIARLQFGPAWQEADDERAEWCGCLRRLWCHYQLPRLGALAELAVLIGTSIAKRREDARTKEGWAKLCAWLGFGPKLIRADDQVDGNAAAGGDQKAA